MEKINKFLKFDNKFTTNVSINLNRSLLLKKIYQILIEEPISSKYKAFHLKNNSYLTKYLLSLKAIPNIHKILNSTYEDCYKEWKQRQTKEACFFPNRRLFSAVNCSNHNWRNKIISGNYQYRVSKSHKCMIVRSKNYYRRVYNHPKREES